MKRSLLIALCLALAGCANTPFGPHTAKPAATPAVKSTPAASPSSATGVATVAAPAPASASVLSEGIALYEKGDYNAAVKRLAQANTPSAPKATQLSALKYTAFSYCLTSRQTLCRQQFEKAFKLDPNFDLEPSEKGHPMWAPAFLKAKKGKA